MIEANSLLTLEQKVGQLFFIGIPGPDLDDPTRGLLEAVQPGGICLFARNIREREQTRRLLEDLRDALPAEPLLSVDQEGGLVDRLRRIMAPMPAANRLKTAEDAAESAAIIAKSLRLLGFNMDFAPVADVIDGQRAEHSNGLFSREFGRSKEDVVELAGSFLSNLQQRWIIGCLKHFPGLGAAVVDSHEELPQVTISETELFSTDLYPYERLISTGEIHAIMVAHAAFPHVPLQEMDRDGKLLPSSLSFNFITNLLRQQLGFDGVVITDDLEMGAIIKGYGIGEACKMAVKAGADMLAICADPERIREGHAAVLDAVRSGDISSERVEASVRRIGSLRSKLPPREAFDDDRLSSLSQRTEALVERLG